MVSKMATGEKPVPLDHCPLIQAFSGAQVTCEELRPDKVDYFALIRAQPPADARARAKVHAVQGEQRGAYPLRRAANGAG